MSPNGIYGGVGSKNASRPWTPPVQRKVEDEVDVPKRFRRLRLRRTRRSKMEPTPDYVLIPITVVAVPMVLLALYLLWDFVDKTLLR